MRLHALHTRLITLVHYCNEEIHEDYIANKHNQKIGQPCHDFEFRLLNVKRSFSPDNSKGHNEKAEWAKASTFLINILEYNHQDETEGCHDHQIVGHKYPQINEHGLYHLHNEGKIVEYLQRLVDFHERQQN
jgi:hypothetical protein